MAEAIELAFNVLGEGIFVQGHQFQPMTYAALCEHVAFESCRVGGPPIRPNKRVDSSSGIIDYVEFYCPHGRKHPEQAASVPKNPRSKRASRQNEERTIMFCDCKFSFRVRRDG